MPTFSRRSLLIWFVLNLIGMVVYLKIASALWVLPGEQGEPGGPGDAFYWLFYLLPLLAIFFVVNSATLFFVIRRGRTAGTKALLGIWIAIAGLWVGTVAIDHYRSIRHVDARYV